MNEWFDSIEPEKRERIINAAILEFAAYPYEKASTNNIVKEAGISKGLLFHYFGSKKDLYDKLIGFVIHTLYSKISEKIRWDETDLFERIHQIALVKMEISKTYPHMFDFLFNVLGHKNPGDVNGIIELYKEYGLDFQQMNEDIYTKNIDFSRFRDQSTIKETIDIVRWTLEKYAEEQFKQLGYGAAFDFPKAAAGMNRYMDLLKTAFYK